MIAPRFNGNRSPVPSYNTSLTLYHQVAYLVQGLIEGEDFRGGQHLPSEELLCRTFGVSRTTIRQALSLLKKRGLVGSKRGSGTFALGRVTPQRTVQAMHDPLHLGLDTRIRVVSAELVKAPAPVRDFLKCESDGIVTRVVRVHLLRGSPLSVVISYLPREIAPVLMRANLKRQPIHEVMATKCGLTVRRSVLTIRVLRADQTVSALLHTPIMEPVLSIRSEGYLADESPVRLTENFFSADLYQYTTEVHWGPDGLERNPASVAKREGRVTMHSSPPRRR